MNLHIFGQRAHHDTVNIIGEPEDLRRLAEAITRAADHGQGKSSHFTADGEGYMVVVKAVEGADYWATAELPYSAEWAR